LPIDALVATFDSITPDDMAVEREFGTFSYVFRGFGKSLAKQMEQKGVLSF
jgi:hypothetical protein